METPKKPNIKMPEGFELFFNSVTGHWALRPIKGFSSVYLKKDTFVPKKSVSEAPCGNGKNANLTKAKRDKNDEFYTRLEDITEELRHYKEHFNGKVVYCPCDKCFNLGRSNFFTYFASHFKVLGLKKLICTQFTPEGRGVIKEYEGHGIEWEYNGELNRVPDESEIDTRFLVGNGSFDSAECRKIMQGCDIVVTNPPFSLFRDFVEQIMDMGKKFLLIGNMNAITYKEIFPLLKNNKMWLGYNTPHNFEVPLTKVEDEKKQYEEDGKIFQKFGNICWYTNLEHNKRHEKLDMWKKYSNESNPRYDNYDAINVNKVDEIPCDYDGVMGVPISFLDKYCPEQFEIVKFRKGNDDKDLSVNGKCPYFRILIRRIS